MRSMYSLIMGPDVRIDDHRTGARVFADLRKQINRQCEIDIGPLCADHVCHPALVIRVQERPYKGHCDGLYAFIAEQAYATSDVVFVQREAHRACAEDTFFDGIAQRTRHQYHSLWKVCIVAVTIFLVAETYFERVLVALRAEEARRDPLVLDERVDGDGGAQDDEVRSRPRNAWTVQPRSVLICRRPFSMASGGLSGVESVLYGRIPVGAMRTKSVKVPPVSMPRRNR